MQYSRFANLVTFVGGFSAFTSQIQRILRHDNTDAVVGIRLAIYIKPATVILNTTRGFSDHEALSLNSQLRELRLEGGMRTGSNTCASHTAPFIIEQIFTADWALDLEHLTCCSKIMNSHSLNAILGTDSKLAYKLQLVNLFNPSELDYVQRKRVESILVRWTVLMQ